MSTIETVRRREIFEPAASKEALFPKELSVAALSLNAAPLFFVSFILSSNGMVVPQIFFARFYSSQKQLLLAIALLGATVAAAIGVICSRRMYSATVAILFMMVTVVLQEVTLLSSTKILFVSSLVLVQFCGNYVANQVDLAGISRADSQRRLNDAIVNILRLLGMLVAPVIVALLYPKNNLALQIGIGGIGIISILGCGHLFYERIASSKLFASAERSIESLLHITDYIIFAQALTVYIGLWLFGANMLYLMHDFLRVGNANLLGSIAIVAVFASALLINCISMLFPAASDDGGRLHLLIYSSITLIFCAGIMAAGYRPAYYIFVGGCILIGSAYGFFLWELRLYTSAATNSGKPRLLAWFNNLGNVSALVAFAVMALLALLRSYLQLQYFVLLLSTIALLGAIGVGLLLYERNIRQVSEQCAFQESSPAD